eukprot:s1760_g18.t1
MAPGGCDHFTVLFQAAALLERLNFDEVSSLLKDEERQSTLMALALLALKFSSTEMAQQLTNFALGNAAHRQMLLYCRHLHCEICPSLEAWLSVYETRLRAKRPKASMEAQRIGQQSRWSAAQMMQNGRNEVPRKFSLIHFVHNYRRCLELYQGRLGDAAQPLDRTELLWVVGCESLEALQGLMDDV